MLNFQLGFEGRAHLKGVYVGRCIAVLLEGGCAFAVPVLPCFQLGCNGRDRCQKNLEMAEIGLEHKTDTSVGRLLTGKKISKLVVLTSYKKSYYLRLFIYSCTFFFFCLCASCVQ